VKKLSEFYKPSDGPAFIAFRVYNNNPAFPEVIKLDKQTKASLNAKWLEEKLSKYLSEHDSDHLPKIPLEQRKSEPPVDTYAQPGLNKFTSKEIKQDQDYKYRKMIEEENKKAQAALQQKEKEKQEKAANEAKLKQKDAEKNRLITSLGEEPKTGDIIKIRLRLPCGTTVSRSFNKKDHVEVTL